MNTKYNENIKINMTKVAIRDEDNYYFYPYAPFRLTGFLLVPLLSFISFVFLFLLDFEWNKYLISFALFSSAFCITIISSSYNYVRVNNSKVIIRSFFIKKEFDIYEVKNILRETKRYFVPNGNFRGITYRGVSYFFVLKDGSRVKLLDKVHWQDCNSLEAYEDLPIYKIDAFVKLVSSDYNLDYIFMDLDYRKDDGPDFEAEYVKGKLYLDAILDPVLAEKEKSERARIIKRNNIKATINILGFSAIVLLSIFARFNNEGINIKSILLSILLIIIAAFFILRKE